MIRFMEARLGALKPMNLRSRPCKTSRSASHVACNLVAGNLARQEAELSADLMTCYMRWTSILSLVTALAVGLIWMRSNTLYDVVSIGTVFGNIRLDSLKGEIAITLQQTAALKGRHGPIIFGTPLDAFAGYRSGRWRDLELIAPTSARGLWQHYDVNTAGIAGGMRDKRLDSASTHPVYGFGYSSTSFIIQPQRQYITFYTLVFPYYLILMILGILPAKVLWLKLVQDRRCLRLRCRHCVSAT